MPETLTDVELFARSILHRRRDFWIVVLTARRLETMPAVPAVAVREIVGANVPIVFLKNHLATHLSTLLPPKTHVYGGAVRVYRPGVTDDPWGHPLLYDPSGEYSQEILDWLGRIFTPSVARPTKLSPEDRVLVLEHEVKRLTQARTRELVVLRTRYEAWVFGDHDGESALWRRRLGGRSRRPGGVLAQEVRRLIAAQWGQLPDSERTRYPLRDYRMTSSFLRDVRRAAGGVSIDHIAWVCSLVICRFDVGRVGLAAGALRASPDARQLTGRDGAKGCWCSLHRSPSADRGRVVYWSFPDGRVELRGLGYPKDAC